MNYLEIYKQCIDFHRKYTDVRDSPEYWESVVSESDAIVKQVTGIRTDSEAIYHRHIERDYS